MPAAHTTLDVYPEDENETLGPHSLLTPHRASSRTTIFPEKMGNSDFRRWPALTHIPRAWYTSDGHQEPWLSGGPYKYPVPQKGDPWEKCLKKVKDHDDDVCDGWRSEVDNLIVFSLQQDPNNANPFLLEQILVQLHNANPGNNSISMLLPSSPPFSPFATDVRVNMFWFMSLSLSLASVSVGILCMQWLSEFQRDSPLDAISLRQLRYEGLIAWKVPDILMSLPILLYASLILFFIGLIDLLCEKVQQHLTSKRMVEYLESTTEEERREINATLFLDINNYVFPQLHQFQLESVIRILNTRLQNAIELGDSVQIQDSLPFIRWPVRYVRGLPSGLVTQSLLCIRKLIMQDYMKEDFEEEIWYLMQLILSNHDSHHSPNSHVQLSFEIMAAFESRLPLDDGFELSAQARVKGEVKAFAKHIIKVLPPGDFDDLQSYARPVLSAIRTRMNSLGGSDVVLNSFDDQKRWQFIENNFALNDSAEAGGPTSA
ncbi:hypothetical protein CPB84DRAFT_1744647 [Gymnopilus junonius]|uniref:DUF6535 domain-containing protein n=1 Tax=Gymnopilus junonius TaxID=109634 RepID=A0A9P5NW31_GYMJU|nr:hypothetical protein CPB84DRAFT_1744647 [Gymnopilus junonius]